ncbi:UDP-2,4-diacetamido-2,4,6-trideoxy-beta-L-altropyranose hydrolase [Cytobacillus oceanisediminis]|uniref:UDP-2,4-diacetamido-2,4, 6-trideoxy-beta-L-altropyranose hydrolase n=1 Tax=Cytobacillus oceanisediminis TaxID=665099 RepID=UPI001FB30261|nr:UDP-2,4-diacetamido-2,4,6-trideoxy-beta-L-altropyranose hydrolase [Cytobacillus oceanisediminis]UOE55167.1 UDP-2,4-diacetamido-2,4,6-trideoxy-beta-L-altropyranose hydrolase [Cytobacillus oceanisediminis]
MNVVIRTDSSLQIGTGHVMRCVTLAKQLEREGANIIFVCRDFPGNSIPFLIDQGFDVFTLAISDEIQNHWQWIRENWIKDVQETKLALKSINQKVDLLIIDHYGIDTVWESELRLDVKHIMVIDDLANRPHDCDILLDQNYYPNLNVRYKGLVPDSCIQLLGPNYVLLRDEFLFIDQSKIKRDGNIENVLIFFGGTDPTEETLKTIKAIQERAYSAIKFNVVVGLNNPRKDLISELCETMENVSYFCQVKNMAELMMNADLAIGAGGTTSWERCFLGLPAITIVVADNQSELSTAIAEKGAVCCLGESKEVSSEDINIKLNELCNDNSKMNAMIKSSREIVNPKYLKDRLLIKKILEIQNDINFKGRAKGYL